MRQIRRAIGNDVEAVTGLVTRVDVGDGWGDALHVRVLCARQRDPAVADSIRRTVRGVLHPRRVVVDVVWDGDV